MARVWSSIRRACGGLASPGPESHSLVVDAPPPSRRQSPRAPPRPSDPNPRRESRSSDRYACVSHATANETPPCRRPGRPRIAPVRLAGPRDLRWHPEAGASGLLRGAVALRPEAGASLRRLDTLAARPEQVRAGRWRRRSLIGAMRESEEVRSTPTAPRGNVSQPKARRDSSAPRAEKRDRSRPVGSRGRRRSVRPCVRVPCLAGRSRGSGSRRARAPSRHP